MNTPTNSRLERTTRFYIAVALISFNFTVVMVLANLGAFAALKLEGYLDRALRSENPVWKRYGSALEEVYPGMSVDEVQVLLEESWERLLIFEPYTHFKERPITGRFVNVDAHGFRHSKNQGPWPPSDSYVNVFLFGGSTAFNYGVPDDQSIASHLQSLMEAEARKPVRVYNFGRAYYYSTQERILFAQLLRMDIVPDIAIFLDGLNEFYHLQDRPYLSDYIENVMNRRSAPPQLHLIEWMPLHKAIVRLKSKLGGSSNMQLDLETGNESDQADPVLIDAIIRRYGENMKLISQTAAANGVRAWFVWQPVPTYGYDLRYHPFAGPTFGRHWHSGYGYRRMAEVARNKWEATFLWCADLQEGKHEPLYVDQVHYTGRMSALVASCILDLMLEGGLRLSANADAAG